MDILEMTQNERLEILERVHEELEVVLGHPATEDEIMQELNLTLPEFDMILKDACRISTPPNKKLLIDSKAGYDYPTALMIEYKALIVKKPRLKLTPKDTARLQAVREEINAHDSLRSRPDLWDKKHQILREELAQIRAEAEALTKA